MSEVIFGVVKQYADAWAANDLVLAIGCYHDEIVFHYFGISSLAGVHRGKPACLEILKQVRKKTNRKLVSIDDVLAGERFGLIVATDRFERSGNSAEIKRVFQFSVRDGMLDECWVYDEDQRLVDDFFA
jgi:uncharacterized protein